MRLVARRRHRVFVVEPRLAFVGNAPLDTRRKQSGTDGEDSGEKDAIPGPVAPRNAQKRFLTMDETKRGQTRHSRMCDRPWRRAYSWLGTFFTRKPFLSAFITISCSTVKLFSRTFSDR